MHTFFELPYNVELWPMTWRVSYPMMSWSVGINLYSIAFITSLRHTMWPQALLS